MSAPTRPTAVAALAGLLLLAAGLAGCAKTGSHGVNQVGGADNRCNAQGQNITIVCGEGSNGADASSTAGAARVAGGHSAAPVSSAAAPQPDVVRWTGSLTLGEGGGIVLDTDPPHYDHWEANADVEQGGLATGSLMGSAALWTSAGRPTAKQCSDWVATMNTGTYFALRVGDRVCARSADGRPALLVVQSLSGDAYGPIVFTATVWETPR